MNGKLRRTNHCVVRGCRGGGEARAHEKSDFEVRGSHIRVASNLQAVRASQMQERESFEIVHGHMFGESSTLVAERVIRLGICLANEAKIAMIVRRAAAPFFRSGV